MRKQILIQLASATVCVAFTAAVIACNGYSVDSTKTKWPDNTPSTTFPCGGATFHISAALAKFWKLGGLEGERDITIQSGSCTSSYQVQTGPIEYCGDQKFDGIRCNPSGLKVDIFNYSTETCHPYIDFNSNDFNQQLCDRSVSTTAKANSAEATTCPSRHY